jgi:hypothetical protein
VTRYESTPQADQYGDASGVVEDKEDEEGCTVESGDRDCDGNGDAIVYGDYDVDGDVYAE